MNFERGRKIGAPDGLETILVKAPSDGIDAKASGQCSSAQCFVVHITEDGEVVDNTNEVEVWNFAEEDVEADAYISCFRFRGSWVFGGGGGGGTAVKMFKSTSAITANGSGTAVEYIYTDGVGWANGVDSFDIINPWADAVSTAKKLTAYEDASGKWVMIQAECEDV